MNKYNKKYIKKSDTEYIPYKELSDEEQEDFREVYEEWLQIKMEKRACGQVWD